MLSKPVNGWTDITIGDWTQRASYLTNPAIDILKSICEVLKTKGPSTCFFDAEGWNYYILFDSDETYAIVDKDNIYTAKFDIDIKKIAAEVKDDIKNNIGVWMKWEPESTKIEQLNIGKQLQTYIEYIENNI